MLCLSHFIATLYLIIAFIGVAEWLVVWMVLGIWTGFEAGCWVVERVIFTVSLKRFT